LTSNPFPNKTYEYSWSHSVALGFYDDIRTMDRRQLEFGLGMHTDVHPYVYGMARFVPGVANPPKSIEELQRMVKEEDAKLRAEAEGPMVTEAGGPIPDSRAQSIPSSAVAPAILEPTSTNGETQEVATTSASDVINKEFARIAEGVPVRAAEFAANLKSMLKEHPDQMFFVGVETDLGESRKGALMPIYKAVDQIQQLKDEDGKPLYPNLIVRRDTAKNITSMAIELHNSENKLNFHNTFIAAKKSSVDSKLYDGVDTGKAWIAALDDSRPGDYLPIFEAITLNMMIRLNADPSAIKRFYDEISDAPIDAKALKSMMENRTLYILPKMTSFDPNQQRVLNETMRKFLLSA
jgi:hypothetical protein